MEMLIGDYKASDGKDYYEIVFNKVTHEMIMTKNAGCTACAEHMALKHWGQEYNGATMRTVTTWFMNTSPVVDMNRVPKKYHRFFK